MDESRELGRTYNPELIPPLEPQGLANDDCVTVWFLGLKWKVTTSPIFAALKSAHVRDRVTEGTRRRMLILTTFSGLYNNLPSAPTVTSMTSANASAGATASRKARIATIVDGEEML